MMWFRLYPTQVRTYLSNGAVPTGVTGFMVMLKTLDDLGLDDAVATGRSAEVAGFRARYGIRVGPVEGSVGWCDPTHWTFLADRLRVLHAKIVAAGGDPSVIGVDTEVYYGDKAEAEVAVLAAHGKTPADLLTAAAPFVATASSLGVTFAVHPASERDEVIAVLANAGCGKIELWNEGSFSAWALRFERGRVGYADNVLNVFQKHAKLRQRYPLATIHEGFSDDILRVWGASLRADLTSTFAPTTGWLFDRERGDKDVLGSSQWVSGAALSSLNAPNHVWSLGWYDWNFSPVVGSLPLETHRLEGGNMVTPRTSPLYGDRREFEVSGSPVASFRLPRSLIPLSARVWSISCRVSIPADVTDGAPILAASQSNAQDWLLRWGAGNLVLDVAVAGGQGILSVPAPAGASVGVNVCRDGDKWGLGDKRAQVGALAPHSLGVFFGVAFQNNAWVACKGLRLLSPIVLHPFFPSVSQSLSLVSQSYPYRK